MGKKSRLKRQYRAERAADPHGLRRHDRVILQTLAAEFERSHGRRPLPGDVLFIEDDGAPVIATELFVSIVY
jgi:hypothetical protein